MDLRLLHLCERAADVPSGLPAAERTDAKRLLSLCEAQGAFTERTPDMESHENTKRELGRLVEFLGRRHAHGVVLASLGRATLARMADDESGYLAACSDVERRLSLMGL